MRCLLGSSLLSLVALAACAGGDADTRVAPCERARDHAVSLRVTGLPDEQSELHRANLAATVGGELVASCQERGDAYVDCVLAATTLAELDRCR